MLIDLYVRFHIFTKVRVTEWPPIEKKMLIRLPICFLSIST